MSNNTGTAVGGAPPRYDVSVRDINNAPAPNSLILPRFADTGVRLLATHAAGTTVDAGAQTASRVGPPGSVNFALRTAGFVNVSAVEVDGNSDRSVRVAGHAW